MGSAVTTQGSFEIPELRGILSEDFGAPFLPKSVHPSGGRGGQTVGAIIMTLRLHQLHSAG